MTLLRIGWHYLTRHLWQTILMVSGIILGVAVIVAVDLANVSASRAFDLSTETVAGRATHQIISAGTGIDDSIYTTLRISGIQVASAPVVTDYVTSLALGSVPMQILGVDLFAEAPFRSYLPQKNTNGEDLSTATQQTVLDLTDFLVKPGAILISAEVAERYGLEVGQKITIQHAGRERPAEITGLLSPNNNLSKQAMETLILADISTAQELTDHLGRLTRIDLILPENPEEPCDQYQREQGSCLELIRSILPEDVLVQTVEARTGTIEQMTSAFRVNLTALSLLALIVGMFLIYNTMTFSVVKRRPLFGTLRCLGVTKNEIFGLVMIEALIVGIIGAALGTILGVLMGQGAVRLVTQTINDLFFVLSVRGIQIPVESLIKGSIVGIGATLVTAAPPAWEASTIPPRLALSRSGLESKATRAVNLVAMIGMSLTLIGIALLSVTTRDLIVSFSGTFAIIIGLAMLTPGLTRIIMQGILPLTSRIWGVLGRMAPHGVINTLSRTSIAVMALMVAISVTIGVSIMVGSFRNTVITWLAETLQGDIYISVPAIAPTAPTTNLSPEVITKIETFPGVSRVDVLRAVSVDSPQGQIQLAATDNFSVAEERIFIDQALPDNQLWDQMLSGSLIISEPLANRFGIKSTPASLKLNTRTGLRDFPVLGIYYDYGSTLGSAIIPLSVYQELWADRNLTAVALRLKDQNDSDQIVVDLREQLAPIQNLNVRSNLTLRNEVLVVFDRTFAITEALQLLAIAVAFIGVLSALLSLELERQREFGILRSIGLTVSQIWRLILLETGLLGLAAGLLAMPTGYILSLILVYIINRRSFGWTLQMQVDWQPFLFALLLAITAALLAGIYPAWRIGRMVTSEALRSE